VTTSQTILEEILQRQPVWRGGALARTAMPAVPSGFVALDHELPGGGWPSGTLTEILCTREGVGELQLVLPTLAGMSASGRRIAWLAPPHLPYAPALAAAGVDLAHLIVVQTTGRRDALWAADQVLRAGACHALLAWFRDARYAELRRLTVAAEMGSTLIILFRPKEAACESSPACLRIMLEVEEGRLIVRILKRRGVLAAAPIHIPINRPVHALGGASFPVSSARSPAAWPCPA